MSPTPRAALALAVVALLAIVLGPVVAGLLAAVLAGALLADARAARRSPRTRRRVAQIVARGVPAALAVEAPGADGRRIRVRQPLPPELDIAPQEAGGDL